MFFFLMCETKSNEKKKRKNLVLNLAKFLIFAGKKSEVIRSLKSLPDVIT